MRTFRTTLFSLLATLMLVPALASAGELEGVTMPDTLQENGNALVLNGMGLRKFLFIKVYVIGLYVPAKVTTVDAMLSADKPWRADMVMLRGLSGEKLADAIEKGFLKNSEADMPKLRERLDRLKGWFTATEEGDKVAISYAPGKGTTLVGNGRPLGTIEGRDFGDAMLKVWMGPDPVSDDLKAQMLGK